MVCASAWTSLVTVKALIVPLLSHERIRACARQQDLDGHTYATSGAVASVAPKHTRGRPEGLYLLALTMAQGTTAQSPEYRGECEGVNLLTEQGLTLMSTSRAWRPLRACYRNKAEPARPLGST